VNKNHLKDILQENMVARLTNAPSYEIDVRIVAPLLVFIGSHEHKY
jgi:hypothetical protein